MGYENLILEKEGALAILYINRPQALNALNNATLLEMRDVVAAVRDDPGIELLIVTGTGNKAFVAGADIAFMQSLTAVEGRAFGALGQEVFRMIEAMEKPVIAAVNGFALGGGCELAMCCDFAYAGQRERVDRAGWCTATGEMVHGGRGRGAHDRHARLFYSVMPLSLRIESPSILIV